MDCMRVLELNPYFEIVFAGGLQSPTITSELSIRELLHFNKHKRVSQD